MAYDREWCMKSLAISLIGALLSSCAPAPKPADPPKPDPTAEPWYAPTVEQLAGMAREAETAFKAGRTADAAKLVTDGQPLINRLLAAPRPTRAAMEAAADLDDLYGRMLMADKRYGWARLQFQKNETRWKHWQPKTPESERRLKLARDQIAECDRRL
jgi:hypothetical protein